MDRQSMDSVGQVIDKYRKQSLLQVRLGCVGSNIQLAWNSWIDSPLIKKFQLCVWNTTTNHDVIIVKP